MSAQNKSITDQDRIFMRKALRLAARGAGKTSPNPLVGAVLAKGGAVIGQGFHEVLGGAHAEVNAIADAGGMARGATLYVTLEPCNHHGLTPPCTKAVLEAGVSRVVCGMTDPNPDVAGGGTAHLERLGVEVASGVLEKECRALNQPFIKYVTTHLPYVRLKAAATLDGYIAGSTGDSKWITNERSRRFGHQLRSLSDAVLVGSGTLMADDPLLTARLRGACRQPVRIVLDSDLKVPLQSRLVLSAKESPVWVVCADSAPSGHEAALIDAGVSVIRAAGGQSGLDLRQVLEELGKRRISSLLAEGGGKVLGSFIDEALADEFYFFYAPRILAGGVGMVSGRSRQKIADSVPVFGIKTRNIDGDLLVSGRFREELY